MDQRTCQECAASFTPPRANSRFCSRQCRERVRNRARPKRPDRGTVEQDCQVCGKSWTSRRRNGSRTCSPACYANLRQLGASMALVITECRHCHLPFVKRAGRSVYCSVSCCDLGNHWYRGATVERSCRNCGVLIVGAARQGAYVCGPCRTTTRRQARRTDKARRRALLLTTTVERFTATEIFERDGWRCHLCKKLTRRDRLAPHPKAATIDHVVPLSQGGDHTRANVSTAHFICNSRKAAGSLGAEQLRLIG